MRHATDILQRKVYDLAPKVSESFANSISSNVAEYDDPYRMQSRVFSSHPLNLIIEYGAIAHEVPIQGILDWVTTKKIGNRKFYKNTAWMIRNSIARNGIPGHFVFSSAYYSSDEIFREQLRPTIQLLHGGDIEIVSDLLPDQPSSYPFDYETLAESLAVQEET